MNSRKVCNAGFVREDECILETGMWGGFTIGHAICLKPVKILDIYEKALWTTAKNLKIVICAVGKVI